MKMRNGWKGTLFVFSLLCLSGAGSSARGDEAALYTTSHKNKVQVQAGMGFGEKSHSIGTTTDGDAVKISGGGGAGIGVGAGHSFNERFDLDFDLGFQLSTITPAVANADGSFTRSFLLATAKYKVPVLYNMQFKFGLGAGYYLGGTMDIDTSAVFGGSKWTVDYGPALGFHGIGEMEFAVAKDIFFSFGLKYYHVTYTADSATYNGMSAPTSALNDEIKNLNGGGIDFLVAFGKYF